MRPCRAGGGAAAPRGDGVDHPPAHHPQPREAHGRGMTILDADAVTALEEVLPARFGGAATDYQLLERRMLGAGRAWCSSSAPRGRRGRGAVAAAFLGAIGADSGPSRIRIAALARGGRAPSRAPAPVAGPTGRFSTCTWNPRGDDGARRAPGQAARLAESTPAVAASEGPAGDARLPRHLQPQLHGHHWLRRYGGTFDWPHDYTFTTIQSLRRVGTSSPGGPRPAVRPREFEMADLCGAIALRRGRTTRRSRPGTLASSCVSWASWASRRSASIRATRRRPPRRAHRRPLPLRRPDPLRSPVPGRLPAGWRARGQPGLTGRAPPCCPCTSTGRRRRGTGTRSTSTSAPGRAAAAHRRGDRRVPAWRPRFAGAGRRRDDIVGLEPLDGRASIVAFGVERLAIATDRLERITTSTASAPSTTTSPRRWAVGSGPPTTARGNACGCCTGSMRT